MTAYIYRRFIPTKAFLHCVSKTSHLWFAITLTYVNAFWYFLIFFVTNKVSNQKALCCATPNNLCFCTTWQNRETWKLLFFTRMLYQCIARIQPVASWFLRSFWLTIYTHGAVWLPKSCNQCTELGTVGGHTGNSGERKSRAPQQLDCVARTMHVHRCAVFLKEKMSSVICMIASDICWDSTISH